MPEFTYEALNTAKEVTSGIVEAENVFIAIKEIEAQGLSITSIQLFASENAEDREPSDGSAVLGTTGNDEQQAFHQRITDALEQRDTLAPALAAFAEELPRGRTRKSLHALASRLHSGATAEELLSSDDLTASWLPLLGSGVSSHRLLGDLFDEATRANEGRTQWVRALVYPLTVFAVAFGVFISLCIFVVPTFSLIFDDFELQLPGMTLWIIAVSDLILKHPILFTLFLFAVGVAIFVLPRWLGSWWLPGRVWNAFTTGNSRQVLVAGRFTRRLSEALAAGLALPTALRVAGRAEGRGATRRAALRLADDAEQENYDLKSSPWARRLPATVICALQAGPDKQPSTPLLQQLADLYTARVRDRCDWSTGFMAQFAIVGMGLTVGFVVLALLLPLVELINALTG